MKLINSDVRLSLSKSLVAPFKNSLYQLKPINSDVRLSLSKPFVAPFKNSLYQLKPINSDVRLSLSKSLVAQFVSIRLHFDKAQHKLAQLDNSGITNLHNYSKSASFKKSHCLRFLLSFLPIIS